MEEQHDGTLSDSQLYLEEAEKLLDSQNQTCQWYIRCAKESLEKAREILPENLKERYKKIYLIYLTKCLKITRKLFSEEPRNLFALLTYFVPVDLYVKTNDNIDLEDVEGDQGEITKFRKEIYLQCVKGHFVNASWTENQKAIRGLIERAYRSLKESGLTFEEINKDMQESFRKMESRIKA